MFDIDCRARSEIAIYLLADQCESHLVLVPAYELQPRHREINAAPRSPRPQRFQKRSGFKRN